MPLFEIDGGQSNARRAAFSHQIAALRDVE
jgi:hypothetical protein